MSDKIKIIYDNKEITINELFRLIKLNQLVY